ncbi:LysR family transcriptional regulator [Photobacterium angustum]|uniref:LysR family transcriptional regulator n=1 Tax=Photobacterium angustum TaxID=661 RepID=UPI0005E29B75|nr:LysR family transcriptional regulator [Photobacterium angustum]KJF93656.1 LysR family transcriptional regulator [Photobacterium angustum]PSW81838.1 LysR family transcriptional regulator [Photobacterium angustum]
MDQLGAMRAFIRVVQTGSFSATAREQNTTQATISKKIAALEHKLEGKLLTRSSRDLALTEVGAEYYERCVAIISELDEAESNVRAHRALPQGLIKIAAPITFGNIFIAPIISEFLARYPDISVDLTLSDKHVDIISEGVDVAIRARELEDSSLIARHLFDNPNILVASSAYIAKYGEPVTPEDLNQHNCIIYSLSSTMNNWNFYNKKIKKSVSVSGNFKSDSCDAILRSVLDGVGIALLPVWMVDNEINAGRLKQLMPSYKTQPLPFHAIYTNNRYVSLKIRCFIDFIKEKIESSERLN